MKVLGALFHLFAALGVGLCATRVLPPLWETNILDCISVGAALLLSIVMFVTRAVTGKWSLE